jgi:hypothetical protein
MKEGGMLKTGLAVIGLSLWAASMVSAQPAIDSVLSSLARQGFGGFEVSRERGQVRIEARRGATERELVYDAATGELLRDRIDVARGGAGRHEVYDARTGALISDHADDHETGSHDDGADRSDGDRSGAGGSDGNDHGSAGDDAGDHDGGSGDHSGGGNDDHDDR